jgi:uncharacterized protein YutE (UPF0331/DUF86 family)
LDADRVSKHFEDIAASLRVLETFKPIPFESFAADPKTHWAVEKGLERCIQDVLDVSAHILAAIGGPVPDEYASLLVELGKKGVLPQEFASRMAPMAGFRNILVHRYLDVDLREVYDALQNRLDDFRAFARYIVQFLEANR